MRSILLFLCILLSSCFEDENHHYEISFCNNSDNDVYIVESWCYPDTTPSENGVLREPDLFKVKAHTANRTALSGRDPYEYFFRDKHKDCDTLMVFVLDAEILEARNVHVREALLYRYDLSLDDLRKCNWRLIYPPQQADKEK